MVNLLSFLGALSCVILVVQRLAVAGSLRRRAPGLPRRGPGISILKPLCGLDDDLEANLTSFRHLDYPDYEVLLGVRDRADAAYPLACALAVRDARFRVVLQRTTPGLNPKVNQLVTLAREARYPLLLISDSNARLPHDALGELAAHFVDPRVACVTHPVSGQGHRTLGVLLDNLHLATSVGAGQLAAQALLHQVFVVGKSMALRREALERLGGFEAYCDVLAEDFVIGRDLRRRGYELRVARTPVWNVSSSRSLRSFFERYLRWGVIHRTAVPLPVSLAQGLLNPLPLLALAAVVEPSTRALAALAVGGALKVALDLSAARALRCAPLGWQALVAVPLKDALTFVTWLHGLFARTVVWRGTRLQVGAGSRLRAPLPPSPVEASP